MEVSWSWEEQSSSMKQLKGAFKYKSESALTNNLNHLF